MSAMQAPIPLFEPRNARTDDDGLRFYTWQGVQYPSVTTIRRMAGLPFGLHQWTITQVVNRAVDRVDELNMRLDGRTDPEVIKAVKTWLRQAAIEERDRSAAIGKRVHKAATDGVPAGRAPIDIAMYLRQFYHWRETERVDIIAVERQVFNLTYGYAGSFDLFCRMPTGEVTIIDIKSGNQTYADHVLQVCGYALGEFIGEDDVVDVRLTSLLHDVSRLGLLHLRPTGWAWEEVRVDDALVEAFLGILRYGKWTHEHRKVKTLLRERRTGAWTP